MGEAFKALPRESSIAAGEDFDTSAANILARTQQSRLPNGLDLALLPKKRRARAVRMQFILRFGDAENTDGLGITADLAAAMLLNGTKNRTRADIFAELERLNTRVTAWRAGQSVLIDVDTRRASLVDALKLVRELLRESTFPSDELARLVRERVATARENALEPATLARRTLLRHIAPYPADDLRYLPDEQQLSEGAEKLQSGDLAAFWRDYMGAGHAHVAAVGDFDADELTRLIATHFSDWRSKKAYAPLPEPWQDIAGMTSNIETRDKENASMEGGMRIPVGEESADYPSMLLATHLLGGGFISSRLATRIRQKEGLSYGVGARLVSSAATANSIVYVSAIYAPPNRARIEAAVREELQRLFADGFTEAELADAKSAFLQSRRLARAQDASLAGQLAYNLRVKRTFAYAVELDAKLADLSLAQLNAAVRRYLQPQRLSIVFAGDFKAARADSAAR
jgi:zinc protease